MSNEKKNHFTAKRNQFSAEKNQFTVKVNFSAEKIIKTKLVPKKFKK